MIITLAGLSGAGKSTVKQMLATELGWKAYSMGDMRGAYAEKLGITIDELNALGMNDPKTDAFVDEFQAELGKKEDSCIVDGWMSWFFIPQSIKVFLEISPKEGARRIFEEQCNNAHARKDEQIYSSAEEVEENLAHRVRQNQERYKKWYGVDFLEKKHYDLIIDTTELSPRAVADQILTYISSRA